MEQQTSTDIDKLIHEPSRMQMLSHLLRRGGRASASDIARNTGIKQNRQYLHGRKLEARGYIRICPNGTGIDLEITEAGRAAIDRYRNAMAAALEELAS